VLYCFDHRIYCIKIYDTCLCTGDCALKDSKGTGSPVANDLGFLPDLSGLGGLKTNSVANEIEILKSKK
jgi:hypothetical protein